MCSNKRRGIALIIAYKNKKFQLPTPTTVPFSLFLHLLLLVLVWNFIILFIRPQIFQVQRTLENIGLGQFSQYCELFSFQRPQHHATSRLIISQVFTNVLIA
jgi:hypothetical protein